MAARHLVDSTPRFALVVWADDTDQELPCCIQLEAVPDAIAFGATVIAREDAEFCKPRQRPTIDYDLLKHLRRHPYRTSADWSNSPKGEDADD